MNRRVALTVLAAICTGCLNESGNSGVRMSEIQYHNLHDKNHTLSLQLKRDDEVVYTAIEQLNSRRASGSPDGALVDDELPNESGQYTLIASIENDTARAVFGNDGESGCVQVIVDIDQQGKVGVFSAMECSMSETTDR